MKLFPAIDMRGGRVVRLFKGDFNQEKEYSNSPVEIARKWESYGASWLHLVDLDAALSGKPENLDSVANIAQNTSLKIQIGGGIRSLETIQKYLDLGVSRVIIGTQAIKDPLFFQKAVEEFPQQIVLGLDTQGGKIAIQGWTETIEDSFADYMQKISKKVACVIHTEIERDGTLGGLDPQVIKKFSNQCPIPYIVSGGVAHLDDLTAVKNLDQANIEGIIIGKALYEDRIDLKTAVEKIETMEITI